MSPLRIRNPGKLAKRARYYRHHADLYRQEGLDALAAEQTANAERIERQLLDAGRCRDCGWPLSDPDSVARGQGPDCAAKNRPRP